MDKGEIWVSEDHFLTSGVTCEFCGTTVYDRLFGFDLKYEGKSFCCLECVNDYKAGREYDPEEGEF